MGAIKTLSVSGFKSIRKLESLRLSNLNVLIGANGSGKSNFVAYFRMLSELVEGRLQVWVAKQGGADRVLTCDAQETQSLTSSIFCNGPEWPKSTRGRLSGRQHLLSSFSGQKSCFL